MSYEKHSRAAERLIAATLALGCLGLEGCVTTTELPLQSTPTPTEATVSGTVVCPNGQLVQGIKLTVMYEGGVDPVSVIQHLVPDHGEKATFEIIVPSVNGEEYAIDVGCVDPNGQLHTDHGPVVPLTPDTSNKDQLLVCVDYPAIPIAGGLHGTCVRAGSSD